MGFLRVSDRATADLDEIWVFIAGDHFAAADRLIAAIVEKFEILARSPEMGRARHDLIPLLRSFPVGNYVIFYRPMTDGIEILRVLHGARDIPAQFE
ncbi:MAG: type II toxin-antitoxin system RelE/ParE family toxin [Verrucomicrobia bacterium]|nr:type II toxin-antitoxin system RelE/ParE family toxin [Verrucomicrobiota bacterium]